MQKLAPGQTVILATHNAGKLAELRSLLTPFGLKLPSAGERNLPAPDETGTTFAENATLKAVFAARASGLTALADDSGLCVDALDGAPGIDTALWGGPERNWDNAMIRVHLGLVEKGATGPDARRAEFVACLCLATPQGACATFEGRVAGTLIWPPRGTLGFGYDPMFQPEGFDVTFGQMSQAQKHGRTPQNPGLSHRARAFSRFVEACCET
ncbi:MAG: non-canonical purine NTP pyrophosphatase [Alphaproteobacteria bacterium]|nr:non-canonical purine NTP pyrophosphatase [Alphaproteobacteria bacterium]